MASEEKDGAVSSAEIDWGYNVNRLMEAARRSVAKADADPCQWELGELIKAKLLAADEGHKIGGTKGIGIVQDSRDEARALIAAAIERQLPKISDENLTRAILETALATEDLRMKDAVHDKFRHQLQLETMCHTLAAAVVLLLCKELTRAASPNGGK